MIAYEIQINGEKVATVGVNEGVVSAIANWTFLRSDLAHDPQTDWNASISVAGLDDITNEQLKWFRRDLRLGDVVTLRLVEVEVADIPTEKIKETQ